MTPPPSPQLKPDKFKLHTKVGAAIFNALLQAKTLR